MSLARVTARGQQKLPSDGRGLPLCQARDPSGSLAVSPARPGDSPHTPGKWVLDAIALKKVRQAALLTG